MRHALIAVILAAALPFSAFAQAPLSAPSAISPNARFEVATIKPGTPGESAGIRILVSFTHIETLNTSVTDLIKFAYGVHPSQIMGGSDELVHRGYALQATIAEEKPNVEVLKQMIRNLLTDRFNLALHHETRELPVYLLTTGSSTIHLKPTEQQFAFPTGGYSGGTLYVTHGSPRDLAAFLQRYVTSRPVLDRTGITGAYDMMVNFTPDDATKPITNSRTGQEFPDLYTALREQLGFKLTATKAPVDVLVIDKVTEPTPN